MELRRFRITKNVPLGHDLFLLGCEPADGKKSFAFAAGQWVMVYLYNFDGSSAGRAAFSIATAPSESQQGFELAVKISGGVTRRLQQFAAGDVLGIQGPFGVFTLRGAATRLVFFAGGIGIAPFRSMIRELVATKDAREVMLFYSNRTQQETAFEAELRELARKHPRFHPFFFITRETLIDWDGICQRIDSDACARHLVSVNDTEFYMCGPRAFMDTVSVLLAQMGVDVKMKLHKENFGMSKENRLKEQ